ncbi:sporulation membrane protein YtrI [Lederbergia lenta]|uniref:Sporulation protein n=1 Tax=Lederbergia lenta TaxID=1467 RepID=A0A2X4Z2T4_LEDLE|nr:sporulation membrane protein YtrI [Lederbergia lenta]MCM3111120.1 sporulation protein [Lederbergia lenta]MEC2325492.1 sporulation protein [Lederbergia lenta]SQI54964.1 sporulation protein [Lederbergia lenta]
MRIPPLYRKPTWQRFFAGAAVGGCISWVIFLFMFGTLQEKHSMLIDNQAALIKELQAKIKIWQDDYQDLNEQNLEMLTIQEIQVKLTHYEKYNINDKQSISSIEEAVKEDLQPLLAKELDSVYKNRDIIKKTIENKTMNINGKRYKLLVTGIHYFTTISIEVELKLAD